MPQRYICTTPIAGVNFYQTYAPPPAAGTTPTQLPSALTELGFQPGTTVTGSNGTRWIFLTSLSGVGVVAGTPFNYTPTFGVTSGAGTAASALVALAGTAPTGTGFWAENSGATLNTTMLLSDLDAERAFLAEEEEEKHAQEATKRAEEAKKHVDEWVKERREQREHAQKEGKKDSDKHRPPPMPAASQASHQPANR